MKAINIGNRRPGVVMARPRDKHRRLCVRPTHWAGEVVRAVLRAALAGREEWKSDKEWKR